ncbi:MAG TPA: alcohol dehydrogenase, partial [Candidatus Polarisedimenticolia bacterium]|nr:alcohol dehydrogenase [Candidatus Polarisedimenticolia bacterium]
AVVNEVTLIGSRCGRFQPAIEALSTGAVKVDDLVAGRFSLEEGADAFRRAAEPGTLKVLLRVAD